MTTPHFAPLHSSYPWEFQGGHVIALKCRADPAALARMIPVAETALRHDGKETFYVWLLDFPLIAGVGTYRELLVVVLLGCSGDSRAANVSAISRAKI
jgi:hypothetical protein